MRSRAIILALFLCSLLAGCAFVDYFATEDLRLTAPKTSLATGESVQVTVAQKGSWFRKDVPLNASSLTFGTTSESALVVEPDGRVTCVGTYGRSRESAWVSADNFSTEKSRSARSHGHLSFDLFPNGPGPALELVADSLPLPDTARGQFVPCCAEPLVAKEGDEVKYSIRARSDGQDLTASSTGTRYTVFFGSGTPNDPHPSIVTGGPDNVTAKNFLLDDQDGKIKVPGSIGRLNRARVIIFFRNQDRVGWRELVIIHAKDAPAG